MLAIPAGNHRSPRRVNVLGRCYLTGRFSGVYDWPVLGVHRGHARAIFASRPEYSIGGGAFKYRWGVASDDAHVSIWHLMFYEKTVFVVSVGVPEL